MIKIHKTYESFVSKKDFKFEEVVIDTILTTIRENMEYLLMRENLGQLAKLGYMYNTLWYAGRVCWGYNGIIHKSGDCEDNPKYKLEAVSENGDIPDVVYDAWGMHISEDPIDYEQFVKTLSGRELSDFEKKLRKPNKTFDEWVEVLTDKQYKYSSIYPNRKSVANHLLCTIGNGYSLSSDGFVISRASGADQDIDQYGEWENAVFREDIKKIVDSIVNLPEVKETLNENAAYIRESKRKYEEERNKPMKDLYKSILGKEDGEDVSDEEINKIIAQLMKSRSLRLNSGEDEEEVEEKYSQYYPISKSSIIWKIFKNPNAVEKSYRDACIEICQEILSHESKEREENVEFARKFLLKMGFKEYADLVPKEIDKYDLLSRIKDAFTEFTDNHSSSQIDPVGYNFHESQGKDGWIIYLNDSKDNDYADDNYNVNIFFPKGKIKKGVSNTIEFLKGTEFYNELKISLHNLKTIEEIKTVLFYVNSIENPYINIKIIVNDKYNHQKEVFEEEKTLVEEGFDVGDYIISLKLSKLGLILTTPKPGPLGSKHPNNKGRDYYSVAKSISIYDSNYKKIGSDISIDERKYNIINSSGKSPLVKWILSEHKNMKESDDSYGTYNSQSRDGKEGKRSLYAHQFMLWLEKNQNNFKQFNNK